MTVNDLRIIFRFITATVVALVLAFVFVPLHFALEVVGAVANEIGRARRGW